MECRRDRDRGLLFSAGVFRRPIASSNRAVQTGLEDVMALVPIGGLWETHITVSDLNRSIRFYRDVVGLTLAHEVPERHVAFFWIGQPRQGMLGLWSTLTSPLGMKLHYAF